NRVCLTRHNFGCSLDALLPLANLHAPVDFAQQRVVSLKKQFPCEMLQSADPECLAEDVYWLPLVRQREFAVVNRILVKETAHGSDAHLVAHSSPKWTKPTLTAGLVNRARHSFPRVPSPHEENRQAAP